MSNISSTVDLSATQAQRVYEFEANLERWQQQLDDRLAEAYRNIIFVFLMNIVVGGLYSPGTPVDTGFARNSWVVGINGPGEPRQPPQPDPAMRHQQVAVISIEDGRTLILDVQPADVVHLTSNCVYMAPLEDGHSGQAPTGMIWLALSAGQQIADQVCREMLS